MSIDKKIAFLGGGNMAEALIKGLLAAGAAKADQIFVADISSDRLEHLKKTYGIIIQKNNRETVEQSGIILLCVKPQVIDRVLEEIAPVADTSKLVISIAAAITIPSMERVLRGKPPL